MDIICILHRVKEIAAAAHGNDYLMDMKRLGAIEVYLDFILQELEKQELENDIMDSWKNC